MKGPVPDQVFRDLKVEKTGDIATTTPGRCYECNTRVRTGPLVKWSFPDIAARITLWCCDSCYYEKMSDDEQDWNDASTNI